MAQVLLRVQQCSSVAVGGGGARGSGEENFDHGCPQVLT